jgi:hypothetical protein
MIESRLTDLREFAFIYARSDDHLGYIMFDDLLGSEQNWHCLDDRSIYEAMYLQAAFSDNSTSGEFSRADITKERAKARVLNLNALKKLRKTVQSRS